jgi:hypothetical protein
MRKSILAAPVVAAAAALTLGMGAAAQASVVGAVSDSNGTGGYYTQSFAQLYNQVDGTFKLNEPSNAQFDILTNGGIGIQLCNATNGRYAQLGVVDDTVGTGLWDVVAATGRYTGDPTGTGSPCDGNSFFSSVHVTAFELHNLGQVPAGTTIQAQIQETRGGLVFTAADSDLANFNYFLKQWKYGFFNEAGAGVSTDLNILSAPAVNDLVDFSGVTASTTAGATHGFAYWNAVSVSSGVPGYAPLITPSAISPSGYTCVAGHWKRWTTGHGKHKKHHKEWVKKKCTGGGASSFSIETGSPIGI